MRPFTRECRVVRVGREKLGRTKAMRFVANTLADSWGRYAVVAGRSRRSVAFVSRFLDAVVASWSRNALIAILAA